MAIQMSVAARNGMLQSIADLIAVNAQLIMYTGAMPANAAAARTGTVVATVEIPDTPFNAPSNGAMTKSGNWEDPAADDAGTLGYFTVFADNGVTAIFQGTITATGGGGDLQVDNTVVAQGQQIVINSLSLTTQNA